MIVGCTVVRRRSPFQDLSASEFDKAMRGTVVKVSPVKLAGGVKAMVLVKWQNKWESTGRHADRMLQVVTKP
jgi:hypothetical protein